MNITEVRVKLMHNRSDRLRAFCSVTIDDDFVVHDLRVIEGRKGYFVAMPSRKLSDNCPSCGGKNELKAKFCGECGGRLGDERALATGTARDKLHVDVAHPINTPCREMLQRVVLQAYEEEEQRVGAGVAPAHEYAADELAEYSDEYDEPDVGQPEPAAGEAPCEEPTTGLAYHAEPAEQDSKEEGSADAPAQQLPQQDTPGEEPAAEQPDRADSASPGDILAQPGQGSGAPSVGSTRRRSRRRTGGNGSAGGFGDGIR